MLKVKLNGVASVVTGGTLHNPQKTDVFKAEVKPTYLGKGMAKFDVLFMEKTPGWYEDRIIEPAVDGDPENNIPKKDAVIDVCPLKQFTPHGWFPYEPFECGSFEADAEDKNLKDLCEAELLRILGNKWEKVSE